MNSFTLAYSSCPNDTFIFHALAHRVIPTHGFDFKITMADVETLNQQASNSFFDITKLSFATFGATRDNYALLRTGAALGRGCGPLVVSLPGKIMKNHIKVAVPGAGTTASV
ncbi:MAG: 1,4-dihydroxy-6-naphthoate synthase, partial [Desulfamplus sp.]|nr:1,4-dihydroxy-6-naphthoate synthase [Desulfamplus sp.]